jgi:hypothetical protein
MAELPKVFEMIKMLINAPPWLPLLWRGLERGLILKNELY